MTDPIFEQFVYAMMAFMDERAKDNPHPEIIRNTYDRAQILFGQAVSEAVKAELNKIRLEIVVK